MSPRSTEHAANQPLAVVALRRDGHEVLHLADPFRGEEAGDQDVRVREVELLDGADTEHGRDPVPAALPPVEDRREHARRVEARAAVPVDRPVRADERDGAEVADDAVLGDREVLRRGRDREVDRAAEGALYYEFEPSASRP